MKRATVLAIAFFCVALFLYGCGGIEEQKKGLTGALEDGAGAPAVPAARAEGPREGLERIVLGGGCFWCTEAVLELVEGVQAVTPGYAGGGAVDPTYEDVCTGTTGHAEVVAVDYDPAAVPLEKLLDVFFDSHDPTTLNRQGNDSGPQYRSIILYRSDDQKERINAFLDEVGKRYESPVVTEVKALERYYPAEEYHQDYFKRNPEEAYCEMVVSPKVEKAKELLDLP